MLGRRELSRDSGPPPCGQPAGLHERLAWIRRVADSPPPVHRGAPGQVWRTSDDCYEFMARNVAPGSCTLETGAGMSTVLFAAWGCAHLSVVPRRKEVDRLMAYCSEMQIDTSSLSFDVRPSEEALPQLAGSGARDLVFIDGSHGFPMPIIDWFYGAAVLRDGGLMVFDDVQVPQVRNPLVSFLDSDPRWELVQGTHKWRAYRRHGTGPVGEDHYCQGFYRERGILPGLKRLKRSLSTLSSPKRRRP